MRRPLGPFAARVAAASLAVGVAVTYGLARYDLIGNGRVSSGLGSVPESVGYWFGSVLPYWWLPLLLFVAVTTALAVLWRKATTRTGARRRGAV